MLLALPVTTCLMLRSLPRPFTTPTSHVLGRNPASVPGIVSLFHVTGRPLSCQRRILRHHPPSRPALAFCVLMMGRV
jgi:hypothetical protein